MLYTYLTTNIKLLFNEYFIKQSIINLLDNTYFVLLRLLTEIYNNIRNNIDNKVLPV